jgi:hypothetical protein
MAEVPDLEVLVDERAAGTVLSSVTEACPGEKQLNCRQEMND